MTIVSAQNVQRRFGAREVLRSASLTLEAHDRVGLVGRNGSGKSTLAKILARVEEPDAGEVVYRADLRVGYLAQEPTFEPGVTAVQAVLGGLREWQAACNRHAEISARIETGEGDLEALLAAQAEAAAEVDEHGGWEKRHEAEAILGHLGITALEAEVATMSGGEKRRVALAGILVAEPDLAILDEPTNHLDVDTVAWLERWLADRFRGALVLVTHDRYLLDRVANRTLEVDGGEVFAYEGGWGRYLEAKAERMAHAERTEANRRNYLRRELEWLRRSPKARTTKAKARVDRIEAAASETRGPSTEHTARITMDHVRSGNLVLEAEDLTVEVAGRRLVEGLTLRLSPGERVGIVGPNGCGKTSLLRVLIGAVAPTAGTVRHGKNTRIALLDQERSGLRDDQSVFENVAEGRSHIELGGKSLDVRAYLERFLFSVHDQRQRVSTLSGGERARVALARALRDRANVVVLDEPTNDLDVMTLATLEEALLGYAGTILVVTHDRFFMDRIATSILAFDGPRLVQTQGGWSDHLQWRARNKAEAASARAAAPRKPAPAPKPRLGLTYAERIELEGLLDRIDEAEQKVATMHAEMADPSFYARSEEERRTFLAELDRAQDEATRLTERWAELESRRDES